MSKIVQLQAENVKRLKAVSIKPDGSLVVIGGANANGKSSLLDSIAYALGGKDALPAEPLRRGTDKGQVVLELDDGIVVKRTFTPGGGGTLTVTSKDGARYGSPQTVLDGLVGRLSFDPLAFSRLDAKAQAATLRELVGLDFAAADTKRKEAFDERTDVNREVKRVDGAIAKLPPAPVGVPAVEVSVDDLAAELERRRAANALKQDEQRKLDDMRKDAVALRTEITEFEKKLADKRAALDKATVSGRAQAAHVAQMPDANEAEVLDQIKSVQTTNAAVRAAADRRRLEKELEAQRAKSAELTKTIDDINAEKRAKLEATKMPIDGLGFDESGVTLNGLPLAQASSAEQLRASVAIGLAMHPALKVLLVRDGSLLDESSLAMVSDMAAKADAQVWVERVGKGAECSVVIEDGQVAGAEQPAPQGNGKEKAERVQERAPGQEG